MTPWEEYLARERGHELVKLRHHWGEAYQFTWDSGQYHARRRDNGAAVHTRTAEGMWRAIEDDYSANPVPRDIRCAAEDAG